jgi:hypothetical protein
MVDCVFRLHQHDASLGQLILDEFQVLSRQCLNAVLEMAADFHVVVGSGAGSGVKWRCQRR